MSPLTDDELAALLYDASPKPVARVVPPDQLDRQLAALYPTTPPPPRVVYDAPTWRADQ